MSVSVLDRVRRNLGDLFQIPMDSINARSSPDTIPAWDSIHHLNLVLSLEQEFGVEFAPEEIEQMLSAELIADLVEEKLAVTGSAA